MSRVKRGTVTKARHKRVLKQTAGYFGQRKNVFRRAQETLLRALAFAYKGRRLKKRDFRSLFITRISAACKYNGINYNRFIHGLSKCNVELNRKMMSQLAIYEPKAFEQLVAFAKKVYA